MDTSKQYIKMCDCPEIQGQKSIGNEFSISYENPDIWIEHEGNFLYARHDVWLPRQDQIQEMILKKGSIPLKVLYVYGHSKYFQYVSSRVQFLQREDVRLWEYFGGFTSMEQLWLAFYMHEKHGKTWDGKKWIK